MRVELTFVERLQENAQFCNVLVRPVGGGANLLCNANRTKVGPPFGGINAAVFAGGRIAEGSRVRLLSDEDAAALGAPAGADRPVPRVV